MNMPHPGQIFFDQLLVGTPFRGLILQGFAGMCAYVGVPRDHWIADMAGLHFECHGPVTYRGEGDGDIRPAGWYWYGWDYQHAGDKLSIDEEFLKMLPPDMVEHLKTFWSSGKEWTLAEVEQDLIDAAVQLMEVLNVNTRITADILDSARTGANPTGSRG